MDTNTVARLKSKIEGKEEDLETYKKVEGLLSNPVNSIISQDKGRSYNC